MAGRYATGLFDLARETDAIDAVKTDLERFDALVAESADLHRLVRSPVFSAEEQLQALSAVLDKAGIGGLAAKFLKLVTANRRLFAAGSGVIVDIFHRPLELPPQAAGLSQDGADLIDVLIRRLPVS